MKSDLPARHGTLPALITVLALADGVLHLSLDFILFHGHLFGFGSPSGPPPGAAPRAPRPPTAGPPVRLPLPLNELFLLNFIGYVVLVLVFWFGPRLLGRWRWLADVALIVYAAAAFLAWLDMGRPNPMGLGYLSKGIEILLVIALVAHAWVLLARHDVDGSSAEVYSDVR